MKGPDPLNYSRELHPPPERRPALTFAPFPTDALPETLREFVESSAKGIGCDPAMIGPAVLATLAGSIGATRRIRLRPDWAEPCVLWCACIAPSGSLKSPAMDAALAPLRAWEAKRMREHAEAMRDHRASMLRHDRDLREWKNGGAGEPPEEPERPTAERSILSDVTVEALAVRLAENPRGVLLVRNELAGLIRGFDAYRNGRGGDAQAWMELHGAGPIVVDRKGGETIHVPRAAVSIVGTVQPGVAARLLSGEHLESGLAARLLIHQPPILRKRWGKASTPTAVREGYAGIVRELVALDFTTGADGEPEPIELALTPEAEAVWAEWFNRHAERMEDAPDDALRAAFAKIEGAAARLALIVHLAALADARTGGAHAHEPVSVEAMRAGIALADWFAHEAEHFYGGLRDGEPEGGQRMHKLAEWIHRRGGEASPRDVARHLRAYAKPDDARAALEALEAEGWGTLEWTRPGDNGGRPGCVFRLANRSASGGRADETPDSDPPSGGIVGVGAVGAQGAHAEGGER